MGVCLFIKYEVLQPLHQNDQDQHGQYKAEVVLQPAGHLEAAAGVALGQVVVKIPAPAGDAEQQVDEAAAGQQQQNRPVPRYAGIVGKIAKKRRKDGSFLK